MVTAEPLATQLVAPAPPAILVERPRLLRRLDAGEDDQITLVHGPLGSGKTSLLASWAQSAAWLSLCESDDHPLRFWAAFLAAFREADPSLPVAALAPPREDPDIRFLSLVVNALAAAPRRQLVVLDDVHLLRSQACLRQFGFVVAHLPQAVRLVLSARAEPRLPLQDARLRGRLGELGPQELAFTESETAQLLAAHGVELEPRLVAALRARTEGWAAGLRLAADGLRGAGDPERQVHEFAGDDRAISDYLLAEVLDHQPAPRRRFLLRTAIVESVCGELADALTEEHAGHDTLVDLRRTNGFVIPLDRREHWFRYQALFGDLLRARAERELGDELPLLRGRAARWYLDAGDPREALRHALAAGEFELAGDLLRAQWRELWLREGPDRVRALLAQLPFELEQVRLADAPPSGDLAAGVAALWAGEFEPAATALEHAVEAGFEYLTAVALSYRALLELWRSGPDAAEPYALRAMELASRRGWTDTPAHLAGAASALCALRPAETRRRLALAAEPADPRLAAIRAAVAEGECDGIPSAGAVTAHVEEALARDDDGALERALAAAEASGHRLMFLAGGRQHMVTMLRRRIRSGTQHRSLAGDLLAAFDSGEATPRVRAPLREPLSERELTVLRYLPTFLPTREIAAELFVSPNTVKSHLRSIYRKLGVQCRREAIDRARELRLLSRGSP